MKEIDEGWVDESRRKVDFKDKATVLHINISNSFVWNHLLIK